MSTMVPGLVRSEYDSPAGIFGSGCARLRLRMLSGPLPAEVGNDGVLRETKRTVEAGAMIFCRVGSGPEEVGFGVGAGLVG